MSYETQHEFTRLVEKSYRHHQSELSLAKPSFHYDGFISSATLAGSGGSIEILCGPPEYHAQIFLVSSSKRWSLADLMSVEAVRTWLLKNRADTSSGTLLKAEIEYAFLLLVDGLRDAPEFRWLYGS